jgi:hypothetical protein
MTSDPQGWTIQSGLTNPRIDASGGTVYDITNNEPLLAGPVMQSMQP